jgi:Cdc6-like AAA superfamily ATPase
LVCPGQPGAGKTIMAATVIHELLHTEDVTSVGIAYLFCNYKRQHEQDAYHFLAALSRQLLYRMETVPGFLMDMYTRHKTRNTRPSQGELKDVLSFLAGAFKKVYIVIDALDECEKDVCSGLLSIIRWLQVHNNMSLLITTRPLREVLDHVPSCPVLEVRASESDVDLYLRARMQTLPKFVQTDLALQEEIITAIVSAVDGM